MKTPKRLVKLSNSSSASLRLLPHWFRVRGLLLHCHFDVLVDGANVGRDLLHLNAGRALEVTQLFHDALPGGLERLPGVLVLVTVAGEVRVEGVVWAKVLEEGSLGWKGVGELSVEAEAARDG